MNAQKQRGDYNVSIKSHINNKDFALLSISSMKLGKELYQTRMQTKSTIRALFNKLDSYSKIETFLRGKINLKNQTWSGSRW